MSREQIDFWLAGEYKSSAGGGSSAIVGQIVSFVGATAPSKWLICDGTICLISAYPQLYALIGNAYGGEADAGTFAIPDLRTRFPYGAGLGFNLHTVGGVNNISINQPNLPAVQVHITGTTDERYTGITATSTDKGHTHNTNACPSRVYDGIAGANQWIANAEVEIVSSVGNAVIDTTINDPSHAHTITGATDTLGEGTPITMLPPYSVVNYIIYTGVLSASSPAPAPAPAPVEVLPA